jgi:hypothetical protein
VKGLVIRPAHERRSRVWQWAVEGVEGRKEGEGRRKEDSDLRCPIRDGEVTDGVVSRDEGCDSCDEKDAWRDDCGRGG